MSMPTRDEALNLVQAMIADGILGARDLSRFVPNQQAGDGESLRQEWERWYVSMGIEAIIGRPLSLAACPFSQEEIAACEAAGEMILCVPRGVSRTQLGELFRLSTWALSDGMVSDTPETEDAWFRTSRSPSPPHINKSAVEVRRTFEDAGQLGFSLERYLVFAARFRHLTGKYPDFRYWTWLLRGRYDRSGMLIAGFDPLGRFSVHAWMPQFRASFLGARSLQQVAAASSAAEPALEAAGQR
jgi:hypothetical protein